MESSGATGDGQGPADLLGRVVDAPLAGAPRDPAHDTRCRRILVVEDNPLNLKLARTLLRLEGYAVLEARTGEQALGVVHEQRPDLILLDIQLPGIDGLEVCRRLKRDPSLASIPVVALTSYAMLGDDRKALDVGCAAYITKPIDTEGFGHTIAGLLSMP